MPYYVIVVTYKLIHLINIFFFFAPGAPSPILIVPFSHIKLSSDHNYVTCYNTSKGGNTHQTSPPGTSHLNLTRDMTSHLGKTQEKPWLIHVLRRVEISCFRSIDTWLFTSIPPLMSQNIEIIWTNSLNSHSFAHSLTSDEYYSHRMLSRITFLC